MCRSETVAPGNRLVSCEKCRHGERVGYFDGAGVLGLCSTSYLLSWPVFTLSPHLSVEGEGAVDEGDRGHARLRGLGASLHTSGNHASLGKALNC